ncbi:MAG: hypothetical protein ABJL17_06815 [Parvibaculum sp.]|uniref:hypothetical protein n=1 Tax=Parvibaculum sp. TaxID=2024848 RepID=UPI003265555F
METDTQAENPYSPGHPWFYVLGGTPLRPKQIAAQVRIRGYRGYGQHEVEKAARKAEPIRSSALRAIRADVREALFSDLSVYRRVVRTLREFRAAQADAPAAFADVHQSVSLKHNHLYNDFARLIWLDELLTEQRDLFDL